MDVLTTSLTALLYAATNPSDQNGNIDRPSVEAFCAIVNREKVGPQLGLKLITNCLHSKNEKQTMLTLEMLDICMQRCNSLFVNEVAKFRFLNEMIKLVSPKYLGLQTSLKIKQRVIGLLEIWSDEHPKEFKIKEALVMLKKQGVVPIDSRNNSTKKVNTTSVFYDEEKTKLLNKLLQSKNPEDLQAANRLIKNMVKEDEKASESKAKKIIELESVYNNVRLLNEMLNTYRPGISSSDDFELIKELNQNCQRLRSNIFKIASESPNNEEILSKILQANDELGNVFDKYNDIIIKGNSNESEKSSKMDRISLLDLDFGDEKSKKNDMETSSLDLLGDILSPDDVTDSLLKNENVLKPSSVIKAKTSDVNHDKNKEPKISKKHDAFGDLGELGRYLIKEQLHSKTTSAPFKKFPEKISINTLIKNANMEETKDVVSDTSNLDFHYLFSKEDKEKEHEKTLEEQFCLSEDKDDDILFDIGKEVTYDSLSEYSESSFKNVENADLKLIKEENNEKILNMDNIFLRLSDIEPSGAPPLIIVNEVQDVTVTLQFGKNKPNEFVETVVVTTINKNKQPLNNYLFQATVPKPCRVKLLAPSATELPSYNAFVPPMAITQIMLIANPNNLQIKLKFVVSFVVGDETVMETGESVISPVMISN